MASRKVAEATQGEYAQYYAQTDEAEAARHEQLLGVLRGADQAMEQDMQGGDPGIPGWTSLDESAT